MKNKKLLTKVFLFAALCMSISSTAFASVDTISQTPTEGIEFREANIITVYESNGYTFSMEKEIYDSFSETEKGNLEKLYSRLATENLNNQYSDIIELHDHSYFGLYQEKYSHITYMKDSFGNTAKVKHYKCAEPTAVVCPYERIEIEYKRSAQEDYIMVYDDGKYTATISKEEYNTLSESTKANFDKTYKKVIEIIEKTKEDK